MFKPRLTTGAGGLHKFNTARLPRHSSLWAVLLSRRRARARHRRAVQKTCWARADGEGAGVTTPALTHYLETMCFGLTFFKRGTKYPTHEDWQNKPVTRPDQLEPYLKTPHNVGLLHGYSGTACLDIDHEAYARTALAAVGVDLDAHLNGPTIRGKRGLKPLLKKPDGVTLGYHVLRWPHPTEKDKRGKPKPVTVLELRAGHGRQDVLPPSLHPDTGKPYEWHPAPPQTREDVPEVSGDLLRLWQNYDALEPFLLSACPWYEKPAPVPKHTHPPREYEGESVIEAYNAQHDLGEVLERYGYRHVGFNRYLPPESESGQAGAVVLRDDDGQGRVFVHNASSPLANMHAHDAFSVFCAYEHNNDVREAVREAARELGMQHASQGVLDPRRGLMQAAPFGATGSAPNIPRLSGGKPPLVQGCKGSNGRPRLGGKPCL